MSSSPITCSEKMDVIIEEDANREEHADNDEKSDTNSDTKSDNVQVVRDNCTTHENTIDKIRKEIFGDHPAYPKDPKTKKQKIKKYHNVHKIILPGTLGKVKSRPTILPGKISRPPLDPDDYQRILENNKIDASIPIKIYAEHETTLVEKISLFASNTDTFST